MFWSVILVAGGGALGAVSRYLAAVALMKITASPFPYSTLLVNVSGSFLIGVFFVLLGNAHGDSAKMSLFLLTGFLGGFTTFSTFSLDFWQLIQQGRITESILYAAASVFLSIAAVFIGVALARQLA